MKKPWRASNRNNPLGQILQTNVRLSKIRAARVDFGHRGMLRHDVLTAAQVEVGIVAEEDVDNEFGGPHDVDEDVDDEDAGEADPGLFADYHTVLPTRPGISLFSFKFALQLLIQVIYLFDSLHTDS